MIVFGKKTDDQPAGPKLCHFCGKDITRKKRIKSQSRGMYACMRCAEERREALMRRSKRKDTLPDLSDDDVLDILGKIPGLDTTTELCKKCGSELEAEAVLCVKCGQPVHGELVANAKVPKRRRGLFRRK